MAKKFDLRKKNQNISNFVLKQGQSINVNNKESVLLLDPISRKKQDVFSGKIKNNKFFYSQLSGHQEKMIEIFYSSCKKEGVKITRPFSNQYLAKVIKTSSASVKIIIKRLLAKNLIERYKSHRGRGGWTQYKLSDSIYSELVQEKEEGLKENNTYKSDSIEEASSNTTESIGNWDTIVIPNQLTEIGFTQNHIQQMQTKFPEGATTIQRSLEALAFDIDEVGLTNFIATKRINSIISWFFGAIKGGGYESSSPQFLSDEERGKKEILEFLRKKKEEQEKEKQEMEELAFERWRDKTPDEEIKKLVPPGMLKPFDMFHLAQVKDYFVKNKMEGFLKELS